MSVQGALDQRVSQLVAEGVAAVRAEAADLVSALEARLAVLEDRLSPPSTKGVAAPAYAEGGVILDPGSDAVNAPEPVRRPRAPRGKTSGS